MILLANVKIIDGKENLAEIEKLFAEYKAELNADISFQPEDITAEEISKIYSEPNGKIYLAVVENEPAGCLAFHKMKNETACELKRLFVKTKFRGLSIGKILIQKAIDDIKNLGYKEIYLDTLSTLKAACKLYEKFGFEQIPPYYYNPLENVVYYRLKF